MKFECPYCKAEFNDFPVEYLVRKCSCEGCGKTFWPILNLLSEQKNLLKESEFLFEQNSKTLKLSNQLEEKSESINSVFMNIAICLFGALILFVIGFKLPFFFFGTFILFIIGLCLYSNIKPVLDDFICQNNANKIEKQEIQKSIENCFKRINVIESILKEIDINDLISFFNENPAGLSLFKEIQDEKNFLLNFIKIKDLKFEIYFNFGRVFVEDAP